MADSRPEKLIEWMNSGALEPSDLTYAAEILGSKVSGDLAIEPLLRFSVHPSRLVREGSVYGLQNHLTERRVVSRLREMAENDDSPGVQQAAEDALD